MSTSSDAFLDALNSVVRTTFPFGSGSDFFVKLPIGDKPVSAGYTSIMRGNSAHEKLQQSLFIEQIKALFNDDTPGAQWLADSPMLTQPAEGFGFLSQEDLEAGGYQVQHVSIDNMQPKFTFSVNDKWQQIDHVSFRDGTLFKGQKSPLTGQVKVLKKQNELKRMLHLFTAFKGTMTLWRSYTSRTNVTLRAPDRASACFVTHALINAKKSMKSDSYGIEDAYRVFCNAVDTDETIAGYQDAMKAIRI